MPIQLPLPLAANWTYRPEADTRAPGLNGEKLPLTGVENLNLRGCGSGPSCNVVHRHQQSPSFTERPIDYHIDDAQSSVSTRGLIGNFFAEDDDDTNHHIGVVLQRFSARPSTATRAKSLEQVGAPYTLREARIRDFVLVNKFAAEIPVTTHPVGVFQSQLLRSRWCRNRRRCIRASRSKSRNSQLLDVVEALPLKLSMSPFWIGRPGSMRMWRMPRAYALSMNARPVNSGPLSLRTVCV